MGSHTSGFQDWFFPVYVGFFAVIALIAVAIVVSAARRPRVRFLSSWPAPKLRWGFAPVALLILLAVQVALIVLGWRDMAAFKTVRAAIAPLGPAIGLATVFFALAAPVEGAMYLLRMVYPLRDAAADADSEDEGGPADGADADDVADADDTGAGAGTRSG